MKSTLVPLVLLSGLAAGVTHFARDTQVVRLPAARVRNLVCNTGRGDVSFQASADTMVTVTCIRVGLGREPRLARVALQDISVAWEEEAETLKVFGRLFNDARGSVGVSVAGPASLEMELHTDEGAVSVSGSAGPVKADSDSGGVTTASTSGQLRIWSYHGDIVVADHRGPVSAQAIGGAVSVTLLGAGAGDTVLMHSDRDMKLVVPESIQAFLELRTTEGTVSCSGLTVDVEETSNRCLIGRVGRPDVYLLLVGFDAASISVTAR
ncbi:hypothetical protein FJY71_01565 [candidate division WOR-3 bacterium]|nr:hypothetical protein [candidate division WOR-3 bacterium]